VTARARKGKRRAPPAASGVRSWWTEGGPGADEPAAAEEHAGARPALVRAAGEALWYYVVQREAIGLRDVDALMRELKIPAEVRRHMGYYPPR
jgi:hypothetical protein